MTNKRRFERRNKRIIKIPVRGDDEISCYCASQERRIEDFTIHILGQKLTRKIELRVCLDCGEKYLPGRPLLQMEKEIEEKVLALANERFKVPDGYNYLEYYDEVDLLAINYSNNKIVETKSNAEEGLIFNFDYKGEIRSIEVLGFYDIFVSEDDE